MSEDMPHINLEATKAPELLLIRKKLFFSKDGSKSKTVYEIVRPKELYVAEPTRFIDFKYQSNTDLNSMIELFESALIE